VFNAANDGLVKREEVATLLKAMAGKHLTESQINALLDNTLPSNPMNFEGFFTHFDPKFVESKMSINKY
jgi:Ca2+-binding EF-hand superfamily protein